MKFYPQAYPFRVALTGVNVATALCGVAASFHHHWFTGTGFIFLGGVQAYSLWSRYWEISSEGIIKSRGSGFSIELPVQELSYAGPVRGQASFPVSKKKDIELAFAGSPTERYARVADRMAFLRHLEESAPSAEVVLF